MLTGQASSARYSAYIAQILRNRQAGNQNRAIKQKLQQVMLALSAKSVESVTNINELIYYPTVVLSLI